MRRKKRGGKQRGSTQDVRVVVTLDQSALDGAPQCPSCFAHTMQRQGDGSFTCPSGCPDRVILMRAPMNAARNGASQVFAGRLGDKFLRVQGRA